MALGFSNGVIVGQVVGGPVDSGIPDAIVSLDYIMAQGQRVQIFNLHDQPMQTLNDRTNKKGVFALFFRWDPTGLGVTLDMPIYKLKINLPMATGVADYKRAISQDGPLVGVVSLREVASGRIPSFKSPTSVEGILKDLKLVLKVYGWKFPNMFLAGAKPSGDYYELLGVARVAV
jgi:hypothetical protein